MKENEKEHFANLLKSLNEGHINGLPQYIIQSVSEGFNILAEKLIKTGFLGDYDG